MADLREWWATASPNERNAKVAGVVGQAPIGRELQADGSVAVIFPEFTETWDWAGSLLDTLGVDTDWEMTRRPDRVVAEYGARCDTAPEAICLAFCLAKGVTGG